MILELNVLFTCVFFLVFLQHEEKGFVQQTTFSSNEKQELNVLFIQTCVFITAYIQDGLKGFV